MADEPQVSLADMVVARNVALKVEHMIKEASLLAASLRTEITVAQVLAAVLSTVWGTADRAVDRDEYLAVYDFVAGQIQQATPQDRADASTSPEDAATAETCEEARALADHWSAKINDVAFEVPEFTAGPDEDPSGGWTAS